MSDDEGQRRDPQIRFRSSTTEVEREGRRRGNNFKIETFHFYPSSFSRLLRGCPPRPVTRLDSSRSVGSLAAISGRMNVEEGDPFTPLSVLSLNPSMIKCKDGQRRIWS